MLASSLFTKVLGGFKSVFYLLSLVLKMSFKPYIKALCCSQEKTMGKISNISKERRKGIYNSIDKTWEYLNKIIEGNLTENLENIIIKTVYIEIVDEIITVNKKYIYDEFVDWMDENTNGVK